MQKLLFSLLASTLMLSSHAALAKAEVEIEWKEPKNYRDIRPANGTKAGFQKRIFKQLEEHIHKLAQDLPDGQKLSLVVTDVDLAGQVWPGHFVGIDTASDVRLIKRIDIPRMTFSYKLTDGNGAVVQEGEAKIKDMAFQDRSHRSFSNDSLRYEKTMLRHWFQDTFPNMLAKTD